MFLALSCFGQTVLNTSTSLLHWTMLLLLLLLLLLMMIT